MRKPAPPWLDLVVLPVVLAGAAWLWQLHGHAWDLGGRSPILSYDSAQIALAGRELAWNGRLASPFGLPIDLVHHPSPPWPLSGVQPGLVVVEAALFKLLPARGALAGPEPRAWLTLILPFCSFLMLGGALALSVRHLFARWWPEAPWWARGGAALTLGAYFVLDPEAQHFATGGVTELPFTLGLLFAFLGLALEVPAERPFVFGAVLGLAGLFLGNIIGLVLLFACGAAACVPAQRRLATALKLLGGFAVMLAPWWFYKWRAFGSPGWDLARCLVWDGVGDRTWWSLYHQAAMPDLPHGFTAVSLIAGKIVHNLPTLLGEMLAGPRGLWLGGLFGWLVLAKPPRPLAATGWVALAAAALGVLGAAATIPGLRHLFPTRVLVEPIGLLALWALLERIPAAVLAPALRRVALVATAALALAWGGWCTVRGLEEARETSRERGVPSSTTLTSISIMLSRELAPGEPLMSNLGPSLAWQTHHPVLHLALAPEDVEACRRRLDFRHIVLVFRGDRRAWPGWSEIVEREGLAKTVPGLGVSSERRYRTEDGFDVVWLVLAPLGPTLAAIPR